MPVGFFSKDSSVQSEIHLNIPVLMVISPGSAVETTTVENGGRFFLILVDVFREGGGGGEEEVEEEGGGGAGGGGGSRFLRNASLRPKTFYVITSQRHNP
jgi:hypothetical protein